MRLDRYVARPHVRGQDNSDRWYQATLFAAAFERQAHGIRMRHVARQGLTDSSL
jgi:hypothetical protein